MKPRGCLCNAHLGNSVALEKIKCLNLQSASDLGERVAAMPTLTIAELLRRTTRGACVARAQLSGAQRFARIVSYTAGWRWFHSLCKASTAAQLTVQQLQSFFSSRNRIVPWRTAGRKARLG